MLLSDHYIIAAKNRQKKGVIRPKLNLIYKKNNDTLYFFYKIVYYINSFFKSGEFYE